MSRNFGVPKRHPFQPVTWRMRVEDAFERRSVRLAASVAIVVGIFAIMAATAHASPRHRHNHPTLDANGNYDPRPGRWCGWWLRQYLGVRDRAYNLARNWSHYGSPASGPAPGVIAVFANHVGIVTAVPGPGKMVLKSGNDGHAVRERERSTRGVIAWRIP